MRKHAGRPDIENPEWTTEEMGRARPLLDILPKEAVDAIRRYRGQRGPQKAPTKERISLRVDPDVVAAYRVTGSGWQTRANEALRVYARKSGFTDAGRPARRGTSASPAARRRRSASR